MILNKIIDIKIELYILSSLFGNIELRLLIL